MKSFNLFELRHSVNKIYRSIDAPVGEGDRLICKVLDCDLSDLHAYPERKISEKQISELMEYLKSRKEGVPFAYLFQEEEFYGRKFYVDRRVLIPRSETELSVEEILKRAGGRGISLLDIGTGSGAVAVTVSLESSESEVHGVDISKEALLVANKNNERLGGKAVLYQSDLYENVSGSFDIIYSNPPYIERKTLRDLSPSVTEFEPLLALDGGEDGLDFYRRIIKEGVFHLKPDGCYIFEIGYNQRTAVSNLLRDSGFGEIHCKRDYQGYDRVLTAWR